MREELLGIFQKLPKESFELIEEYANQREAEIPMGEIR